MGIKIRTKLSRGGNRWLLSIPKQYVDDGNLIPGMEYEAILEPRPANSAGAGDAKVSPPWSELLLRATGLSTDSIAFAEAST